VQLQFVVRVSTVSGPPLEGVDDNIGGISGRIWGAMVFLMGVMVLVMGACGVSKKGRRGDNARMRTTTLALGIWRTLHHRRENTNLVGVGGGDEAGLAILALMWNCRVMVPGTSTRGILRAKDSPRGLERG